MKEYSNECVIRFRFEDEKIDRTQLLTMGNIEEVFSSLDKGSPENHTKLFVELAIKFPGMLKAFLLIS
jgi:hypothetical protein